MRDLLILIPMVLASTVFAQDGGTPTEVELLLGTQMVLDLPEIVRVAVGDPNVADVKTVGRDQLLLVGSSGGKTDVIVWLKNGQRRQVAINVKGGQREAGAVERLQLEKGELKDLNAAGAVSVELGDPKGARGEATRWATVSQGVGARALRRDVHRQDGFGKARRRSRSDCGRAGDDARRGRAQGGSVVNLSLVGSERATPKDASIFESKVPAPGRVTLRALKVGQSTVEILIGATANQVPVEVVP